MLSEGHVCRNKSEYINTVEEKTGGKKKNSQMHANNLLFDTTSFRSNVYLGLLLHAGLDQTEELACYTDPTEHIMCIFFSF